MNMKKLNMQNPIIRILFLLEFVAVYAWPVLFLLPGAIVAIFMSAMLISADWSTTVPSDWYHIVRINSMVIGGYLGMAGVLRLALNVLEENSTYVDVKTLFFTLVGCITTLSFALPAIVVGEFEVAVFFLAPVLVATQLFFMNWKDIRQLFHRGDT